VGAFAAFHGSADAAVASLAPAVPTPTPTPVRADTFDVAVDPSALSRAPLDRQAFVEDVCSFATAGEIGSFFAFHDGAVSVEGDDGMYAGSECAYAMEGLDVYMEIHFSQLRSSSTEELRLGGVDGVRRDVSASTLENRARVQIPFGIPGSPVEALVVQFHVRGVPPADEEALSGAIDALATNLIERLGVGAFRR
jgi:hypothetical protein